MDFSRILNKPFLVATQTWTTSNTIGKLFDLQFPNAFLNNYLPKVPFDSSSLYRMKGCVMLQVSGTPMHQGLLLAGVIPSMDNGTSQLAVEDPTQLMLGPHSFLNANESTSVCIEVPFYQRTPLAKTSYRTYQYGHTGFDYARLYVYVMNELATSATASTSLTVSVHFIVTHAEFYVPKTVSGTWLTTPALTGVRLPRFAAESFVGDLMSIPTKIFDGLAAGAKNVTGDLIDSARKGVRQLTGFHNPNSTTIDRRIILTERNFGNNVDQPTLIEKLDQHAQFDRIVQDYQFDTDVDEMSVRYLASKPAYAGTFKIDNTTLSGTLLMSHPITPLVQAGNLVNPSRFYSPLRLFYEGSRYWRGSLKLHLQSVMTNFHYCKLLIVRDYCSDNRLLTSYPSMDDQHNLLTETIEFSAGGQINTIDLPFCSSLEQLECTKFLDANALSHGMVYVYLLQPLTNNGTVPLSVSFNAYFSAGKDLQFYGYAVDQINWTTVTEASLLKEQSFKAESGELNAVTVGSSDQGAIDNQRPKDDDDKYLRVDDFKPMINIRDYMRRFTWITNKVLNVTDGYTHVGVKEILSSGESVFNAMMHMYFGFYGGFKFKVLIKGLSHASLHYIPPSSFVGPNKSPNRTYPISAGTVSGLKYLPTTGRPSNMFQEFPGKSAHGSETDINRIIEFEFVIPNMNPYRFMGGTTSYTSNNKGFDCAMGDLIISSPIPVGTVTAEFYIALTDETRLGYQVFIPRLSVPTTTLASVVVRNSAFWKDALNAPVMSAADFKAAYYMKLA